MTEQRYISVGKITGVFGVKGWLKVFSYTAPRENIIMYSPWRLSRGNDIQDIQVVNGKRQGKHVVVQLQGITDRDHAEALYGWDISVNYQQLPKTAADEYYWADLVGLTVVTIEGAVLGKVETLLETGANDVVVVKGDRERLIPFLQGNTIVKIDLDAGVMTVDWDPEF